MLDNLQSRAYYVVMHDDKRAFRVGIYDRPGDFVMLVKRILGATGDKLKYSKRRKPLPKTSGDGRDAWIVCALINQFMKLIVHCSKIFVTINNSLHTVRIHKLEPLFL